MSISKSLNLEKAIHALEKIGECSFFTVYKHKIFKIKEYLGSINMKFGT